MPSLSYERFRSCHRRVIRRVTIVNERVDSALAHWHRLTDSSEKLVSVLLSWSSSLLLLLFLLFLLLLLLLLLFLPSCAARERPRLDPQLPSSLPCVWSIDTDVPPPPPPRRYRVPTTTPHDEFNRTPVLRRRRLSTAIPRAIAAPEKKTNETNSRTPTECRDSLSLSLYGRTSPWVGSSTAYWWGSVAEKWSVPFGPQGLIPRRWSFFSRRPSWAYQGNRVASEKSQLETDVSKRSLSVSSIFQHTRKRPSGLFFSFQSVGTSTSERLALAKRDDVRRRRRRSRRDKKSCPAPNGSASHCELTPEVPAQQQRRSRNPTLVSEMRTDAQKLTASTHNDRWRNVNSRFGKQHCDDCVPCRSPCFVGHNAKQKQRSAVFLPKRGDWRRRPSTWGFRSNLSAPLFAWLRVSVSVCLCVRWCVRWSSPKVGTDDDDDDDDNDAGLATVATGRRAQRTRR